MTEDHLCAPPGKNKEVKFHYEECDDGINLFMETENIYLGFLLQDEIFMKNLGIRLLNKAHQIKMKNLESLSCSNMGTCKPIKL